jgi:hypothetical protein
MDQEVNTISTPVDQTPEQPSISLQDLVVLLNVVRITAERGAIKADEMAPVGTVYQKLYSFLKASGAITEDSKETS